MLKALLAAIIKLTALFSTSLLTIRSYLPFNLLSDIHLRWPPLTLPHYFHQLEMITKAQQGFAPPRLYVSRCVPHSFLRIISLNNCSAVVVVKPAWVPIELHLAGENAAKSLQYAKAIFLP